METNVRHVTGPLPSLRRRLPHPSSKPYNSLFLLLFILPHPYSRFTVMEPTTILSRLPRHPSASSTPPVCLSIVCPFCSAFCVCWLSSWSTALQRSRRQSTHDTLGHTQCPLASLSRCPQLSSLSACSRLSLSTVSICFMFHVLSTYVCLPPLIRDFLPSFPLPHPTQSASPSPIFLLFPISSRLRSPAHPWLPLLHNLYPSSVFAGSEQFRHPYASPKQYALNHLKPHIAALFAGRTLRACVPALPMPHSPSFNQPRLLAPQPYIHMLTLSLFFFVTDTFSPFHFHFISSRLVSSLLNLRRSPFPRLPFSCVCFSLQNRPALNSHYRIRSNARTIDSALHHPLDLIAPAAKRNSVLI
ncbi:hypothetical protein DFP72DRAFT_595396 [Ephemerocybe angulata]|uniref:Uncharacterized protein n=1 Tax=Ephemerocybe angulata TaxID=980116 RepID=A0A8H6IDZ7_9AGAR|nr:hypothetical protein DFP72DRAFT_595396 [Tulosesus angulatus]